MTEQRRRTKEDARSGKGRRPTRRWRLFGRGRNRRLRRATPLTLASRRETEDAAERASLSARVKAGLWATARTLLVLAVLVGLGFASFHGYRALRDTRAFDIKEVEVIGAKHVLPREIRELVAPWRGTSAFALDRRAVAARVEAHPWVRRAQIVRILPQTLRVEVEEQRAVAVAHLEGLYLVNADGDLFKRATQAEADGLTIITGPSRVEYQQRKKSAHARIRLGLAALESYQSQIRPDLSEVHVGSRGEVTFFLRKSGTALRFGRMLSPERLRQLDAVWTALGPKSKHARALYLDHEVRANRVIVRMNDRHE